ncbi:DegT/DnrJ/EryC1/StrS family aminotransferase [Vogesella mureinivorans]|uniref:DegT/DnrJ/EryC1/StrS family aminotransferase n=1 Tax=Vogesella mureinivorans TaxID=657276 RepID=UPI0011CA23DC|nr:DegT/DnrJ/EryC1/StrS family aminotransferase [Vogesella mureinivorans]
MKNIPLFKVVSQPNFPRIISNIITSGSISAGSFVTEFAEKFGELVDQKHVVTVNDMSNAIQIALKIIGVQPGDEIIASPFACMSTNAPIFTSGAKPVWVDINPETGVLDPDAFEAAITTKTKAVIVYHFAGYPAEIEKIKDICDRYEIKLIEDCDNALMATVGSRQVGVFGDFAIFSFYPNRQINAMEGGALCCKNPDDAARAIKLRRYGIDLPNFRDSRGEINAQCDVPEIGFAATLNNLCSAVGLAQLSTVYDRVELSRRNDALYRSLLASNKSIELIKVNKNVTPSPWVFPILVENRDTILLEMKARGIGVSSVHFDTSQYSGFNVERIDLPGVDKFYNKVIALPCGWWMSCEDVNCVVDNLVETISNSV